MILKIESIIDQGRNKIMRIAAQAVIVTAGVVGFMGSAFAADLRGRDQDASIGQHRLFGDHRSVVKRPGW